MRGGMQFKHKACNIQFIGTSGGEKSYKETHLVHSFFVRFFPPSVYNSHILNRMIEKVYAITSINHGKRYDVHNNVAYKMTQL